MRYAFSGLYIAMVLALLACVIAAGRSYKKIGGAVAMLEGMLIPPVIGNLIIILAQTKTPAMIGYYIYFLGMDAVMMALLQFTASYCLTKWPKKIYAYLVYTLVTIDCVQYLLNPFFGHAFDVEAIPYDNGTYYRLLPGLGQAYHRVIVYAIFAIVLLVFIVKIVTSPRIYVERYMIITITMLLTASLQTYFIFSRTPIDRSMAGYGVFGLLIFYFAIYYRPLTLLDRLLADMASEIPDAMFFYDVYGRCIWANQKAIEFIGIPDQKFEKSSELLQEKFGEKEDFYEPEWECVKVIGEGETAEYYYQAKRTATDQKGMATGSFLTIRDITAEQIALQKERYNATHDPLTDLFTKEHLYECIKNKLDKDPDTAYLVLYIDILNFKLVNDIYGSAFGDRALQEVADFLRRSFSKKGLFGRLGGDTFGVLLPKNEWHEEELEKKLAKFMINDGTLDHHIVIHIGVYEIVERSLEIPFMFDRALLAMTTIRDEYQNHIAVYDEKIRNEVIWAQRISAELHDALKQRHVVPYLQPIVDSDGVIVGAEALARWIHPEDGFLSPASFIPVFEKNGMIIEIDRYMWRCACEILAEWEKEGRPLFLSVNISPKDFYFMDVKKEIIDLVKEFGIRPEKLRIEITETVMMTDVENRMKMLEELRKEGFIVEMDDFGSGYSSLNLLKDMPVDLLKIDMKFLTKTADEGKAKTILQNIINLSDNLGINSLTEGVETEPQLAMLSEMGCKLFQGYFFSKPMEVSAFEACWKEKKQLP